jgi:ferritin-like metal-binding protein YciE
MNWVIATAQAKIEHYEIASYRGLIIGAEIMKNEEIAALLQTNLRQEEGTADAVQGEPQDLEEKMAEEAAKAEE